MYRGEIWWASLPDPVGSEPGYRRPVLIVQDDRFTQSRMRTIVVVAITSNIRLAEAPGNVFLPCQSTQLPKDSVANISQIVTIDKSCLTERVGCLSRDLQDEVDEGLRTILYL